MKAPKTETVTLEAHDRWLRHVWITSENGKTCRRVDEFVVYNAAGKICRYDGTDVHDAIKAGGYAPRAFNVPIKWNVRKSPDYSAEFAHMVKAETVWDDAAYTLYVPAEYAQVDELPPVRSGYYMHRSFASPIFGKCSNVYKFPGYEPYKLQTLMEHTAAHYGFCGLDIIKPGGAEIIDNLIKAIEDARAEAHAIADLSDEEFFASFAREEV